MGELSSIERAAVERAGAEPMLDQVLAWAAINSGSRNLGGLERDGRPAGRCIRGAARACCGSKSPAAGREPSMRRAAASHDRARPAPAPDRAARPRRCSCCSPGTWTRSSRADHAFQETRWLEDGVLNGPGVADMKGGLAVMLAALKAVEASPAGRPHRL